MKKIAVLISDGTEEIEAITPIDILRRADVKCDVFSVRGIDVVCSHGITIKADYTIDQLKEDDYDGIVIPGGMPGAKYVTECQKAVECVKAMLESKKLVSAICASPAVVLAKHGLIDGKKVTCYPATDFIDEIKKRSIYTGENVQVDGNVITANGPRSAMEFALKICEYLQVTPKF